jgi:hypothetical protein
MRAFLHFEGRQNHNVLQEVASNAQSVQLGRSQHVHAEISCEVRNLIKHQKCVKEQTFAIRSYGNEPSDTITNWKSLPKKKPVKCTQLVRIK